MEAYIDTQISPLEEKHYNPETNWGVYRCSVEVDQQLNLFKFSWADEITVVGVMPKLEIGKVYQTRLQEVHHQKFGYQYQVQWIFLDFSNSPELQKEYLRAVLPDDQFQILWEAYQGENILQLMKDNQIDLKRLKGIGMSTYQQMKDKVLESFFLHDLFVELTPYDISYKQILRLVKEMGSLKTVRQELAKNPYLLYEKIPSCSFLKVDSICMSSGTLTKQSPFRIGAAILYILRKHAQRQGHSWIDCDFLIEQMVRLLQISKEQIFSYIQSDQLHPLVGIDHNRVFFKRFYEYELQIAKKIQSLIRSQSNIQIDNIQDKIKQIEQVQGFSYTDEQLNVIYQFASQNVVLVKGKAGTGKSTCLRAICDLVKDAYSISICALSGKAAQRAKEATGCSSTTIHRLLQWIPEVGFEFNEFNPLQTDVLIVDEMSMIDIVLFRHLITATEDGCKVVLVGDIQQLPPIGVASPFRDLIESNTVPQVTLTQIQRQAKNSATLQIANRVREGKHFLNQSYFGAKVFGVNRDFVFVGHQNTSSILEDLFLICKKFTGDIFDLQILSPLKSHGDLATKNLNPLLQDIFNPINPDMPVLEVGKKQYRVGDKVIHSGNNYEKGVYNGTIGRINKIENRSLYITFENDEIVFQTNDELQHIEHCFATTIHRYQGSGSKFVIIVLDLASSRMLSRQLLYTALTRTISKCYLIAQMSAVNKCIYTSHDNERQTFLRELLL